MVTDRVYECMSGRAELGVCRKVGGEGEVRDERGGGGVGEQRGGET